MNFYMCECCGEVYTTPLEECPRAECDGGYLVQMDELMLPIVKVLHDRGYETDSACSAHAYIPSTIPQVHFAEWWANMFNDDELHELFDNVPGNWSLSISRYQIPVNGDGEQTTKKRHVALHYDAPRSDEPIQRHYAILEANLALLEFVQKLPVLEY